MTRWRWLVSSRRLEPRPSFRPTLLELERRVVPTRLTVGTLADAGPDSLRDVLSRADNGDTIDFATNVRGVITLTSGQLEVRKSVTIEGPGAATLAVSGNTHSRVFEVFAGTQASFADLTVTLGRASIYGPQGATGGGVRVDAGANLIVRDCVLSENTAGDRSQYEIIGEASGGAIFNAGTLTVTDSVLIANVAAAANTRVAMASGGGIANASGTLTMTGSVLVGNIAAGYGFTEDIVGYASGSAYGGGLSALGVTTVNDCILRGNFAWGNAYNGPGGGYGGGVYVVTFPGSGQLTLTSCALTGNVAKGTSTSLTSVGDGYGGGLAIQLAGEPGDGGLRVANNVLIDNSALGYRAFGGGIYSEATLAVIGSILQNNSAAGETQAYGGGIIMSPFFSFDPSHPRTLAVIDSTLLGNSARTTGLLFGLAQGGGIWAYLVGVEDSIPLLTVTNSTLADNSAHAASAALRDAEADGGGIYADITGGNLAVTNSTLARNSATAIAYGAGTGLGAGGGISNIGPLTLTNATLTDNLATTQGGAIDTSSFLGQRLMNTIVAGNVLSSGSASDIFSYGTSLDLTYSRNNLIGIGGSGGLVDGVNGNLVGVTDPKLGVLGDYGGPTPTIPLLAGSPALDAGDRALAPEADQRGVSRNGVANIGAFQATASSFRLSAADTVTSGVPFDVVVTANDVYGNMAVGFTGVVSLTSTDPAVPDLGMHTFRLEEGGTYTFADVILETAGDWTLRATSDDRTGNFDVTVLGP